MMEAEIYAIRKALKLLSHDEVFVRRRIIAAEEAVDSIEKLLGDLVGFDPAKKYISSARKENNPNNQHDS